MTPTEPLDDFASRAPAWGWRDWFWFISKNGLGWLLIVSAWPIGILIPGPGGIPLFLIGFALITFPGKRKLTARVLRGRQMDLSAPALRWLAVAAALALAPLGVWWLFARRPWLADEARRENKIVPALFFVASAGVLWLAIRGGYRFGNFLLRRTPRARRKVRPWLRQHGFDLLPPRRRRRRRLHDRDGDDGEEILLIHRRHHERIRSVGSWLQRRAKLLLGIVITAVIFIWLFRKIELHSSAVRQQFAAMRWRDFLLASAMFAVFLFVFRALSWWRILKGFGNRLPIPAATRIWSTSELARYLPGVIWQVVGRVYLCKPYGVRGSVCSTSQLLELIIFLIANIIVALACLLWLGAKMGYAAQAWLYGAAMLLPLLCLLLHPKILYRVMNRIMRVLGKPPLAEQLSGRATLALLAWAILGLLWQSIGVWLLTREALGDLKFAKWWVVAGAYCLAWIAGFLAVWAPGGIGVRELVFMMALQMFLPRDLRQSLNTAGSAKAITASLALLLRLWTVAGELIVAAIAYAADYRGALALRDAPGRTGLAQDEPADAVQEEAV